MTKATDMQQHYLLQLTTPKSGIIVVLLTYSEVGELIGVELRDFTMELNEHQRVWLWTFLPKCLDDLPAVANSKYAKVTPVENDLSFAAWWEFYGHKVGNKKRAQAHWDKLDDMTKALCFTKTREYKYYSQIKGYDMVYPERFLGHSYYENDFKSAR
ncbi:MAG: hypothetical protein D6772_13070 [Bacteroidetes bacterium]|nr:MAG: hypothetical protein D6772_13070 [Bacteroidota bacterium]